MHLVSSTVIRSPDIICRRTILSDGYFTGVVFTSDIDTKGRSLTNVIERLISSSSQEINADAHTTFWYEERVGDVTGDGVRQEPCFLRVALQDTAGVTVPVWSSLQGHSFGSEAKQFLDKLNQTQDI